MNMTHVILILNHMFYEVNADGNKDNGVGKEVEVSTLTVSGPS